MGRRVNIFGQPLAFDVGVEYQGTAPRPPSHPVQEGDDLSKPTKDTVVKLASDMTAGKEGGPSNANAYPLSDGRAEKSIYSPDGTTPPLADPVGQAEFVPPDNPDARRLASYSNSAVADGALPTPGDASFVKKGRSASGEVDGHSLLRDPGRIERSYVSPILSNNRFTSERTRSQDHSARVQLDEQPEAFGSFNKFGVSPGGATVTEGHLANVGPMLTLRATKELKSVSSQGYGTGGPDGGGAKAASLLPGLAQIGIERVSVSDLEAVDALRALVEGKADPANITADSSGPRTVIALDRSYGQMNNVLERFSGLLPLGMVAAAAAMSVALSIAIRAVLAVFLLITNASSSASRKRDDVGRFLPGNSRFNPAFEKSSFPPIPLPAKLFGLQETVNPFGDAVEEGIKTFFGGDIGGQLARVLETPGFYLTFCRTIIRSAAELARIVEDVGRGDPISIAENIIAFVDAIKASKIVAVMNIFAQIGDNSLIEAAKETRRGKDDPNLMGTDLDVMEGLDSMRSRKKGSLATAWGASTTKSALILPNSMLNAAAAARAFDPNANLESFALDDQMNITSEPKLSTATVENLEKELDSEYVPFYFHDLRTNEIVSFHAFLSNLTDDYAASYESMDGYGRIDAVKTYKSTARKIGFQFIIAATNQEDFDRMWLKINKLVTLVYPQWTEGTKLQADNDVFIQPFSQIPGATPVTRIRVGDLWTSNYSKFSLARIFGLGSDSTLKIGSSTTPDIAAKTAAAQSTDFFKDGVPEETTMVLEPGDYEADTQDQGALGAAASALASVASSAGVKVPSNARVIAKLRVPTRVKVVKKHNPSAYSVKILDKDGLPDDVSKSSYLVSRSHLSITRETYNSPQVSVKISSDVNVDKLNDLRDFLSPENNALVKSFESSKGRGIACVIESMNFDWNDVPWETGVAGSRAPKMCKVSISTSVIHDIAPGIDANGFNRAPVYNVGRQSNAMAGRDVDSDKVTSFSAQMNKVRKSLI